MYILKLLLSSTSKMVSMDFFCNPMSLVFAISALTLVFLMKILVGKSTEKKRRYHPIGGTIFNQLFNFNRLHHYMTDLAGKHRTYRLLSPFRNEIYTADPANVEYILKTNFENYGKVKVLNQNSFLIITCFLKKFAGISGFWLYGF